ncbi:MAG: tetratricopeptide repeat protein, partial [Phycisphaerae bacterium]
YLAKLAWPSSLSFVYPKWSLDPKDWLLYLFPICVLLAVTSAWALRPRIGKLPLVVALAFVGTLFPALGFFDIYPMRYYYVADHYQYLASVGPIAALAATVAGVWRSGEAEALIWRGVHLATRLLPVGCGALLCIYGVLSWRQASVYRDVETLYRSTLARNPTAVMAHNNLGELLGNRGDHRGALAHLQEAVRLDPGFCEAQYNLGTALSMLGRTDEALKAYQQAIRIQPDHVQAHTNLGNVYLERGQAAQAVAQYRIVLRKDPRHADAHANLGVALRRLGRSEQAVEEYRKAIAINGRHVAARCNLADLLAGLGRVDEAMAEYRRVIVMAPGLARAYTGLGNTLAADKRVEEARHAFQQALSLNPDDINALRGLEALP